MQYGRIALILHVRQGHGRETENPAPPRKKACGYDTRYSFCGGSLRPAVVALIAGAGCSILKLASFYGNTVVLSEINLLALVLFAAALLILRIKKTNPILVMVLCGAVYTVVNLLL